VFTLTELGPKEAEMRIIGCDLHARQRVGDVGHRHRRGSGGNSQARRRQRARVLFLAATPGARGYRSHGIVTALAIEVFLGDPARFADSKALASYVGMIPREYSSGGRQRLGGLSKQGNPLLRFLWGEAGAHAARKDPELQRFYRRKLVQKGLGKASVAVARKLGIRLWIMLRDQIEYNEFCRRGQKQQKSSDACAGMPETPYGAKSHRPVD
jgi:transposase